MKPEKVNLKDKFELFNEHWTPKIIGELNGQQVKLAKLKGEFVWHDHKDEDEMFLVIKGSLKIEFRDKTINLSEGEMYIVPKGVEHNPVASEEAWILLFEPATTKHTGDVKDNRSVENLNWI
ncbi:cupin domain-containing protein [Salegentibacter salarius]|uniref:Mannose-6-phosphate isomerase n=1 Tax=Salegentibacter salarius TaxID=435906 RepID=A0A2N0U1U9_9FLAO|nr:cupin domain-containing protein [Salegentibacter salarius]OEY73668.1 mannose-6-phosphate isomerase [Salegentibacter salarius]PKD20982.1 mannose-6-phosphate isomerase [Salegentibacter salarius]SLJ94725.1 Mannose-6-phosphate isomerase, cupin superfamily [Salegentibacter salarius]